MHPHLTTQIMLMIVLLSYPGPVGVPKPVSAIGLCISRTDQADMLLNDETSRQHLLFGAD
jgi:hypothetical protein